MPTLRKKKDLKKKNPNFISQGNKKAEENQHTVSIRKGIINIGAEINDTENRKNIEKNNKTMSYF